MRRGEVWWARLAEPRGRRPVLLLSRNAAYAVRGLVTVAAVTTRIRGIDAEVPLGPDDGMPRECVVNCDVIDTIPKSRLDRRAVTLSAAKLAAADDALRYALGFVPTLTRPS